MWQLILGLPGLITGAFGTINNITNAISNEKIVGINAKTDQERIESQERVNTLQLRRDVLIAEAGSKLNQRIRAALAAGPAVLLLKLFVWDKVVGSFMGCAGKAGNAASCVTFNTDPLDPNLWNVVMVVLGFYFLSEGAIHVAKVWRAGQ